MRKGEATRARIIEEASRQAAVKGLGPVSLNDVAEAVGLSKSGLFKHFDSKEAMQTAIVEALVERFTETVWRPVQDAAPGRERLEKAFDAWLDWCEVENAASGCPLHAFGIEFDDQPGAIRDLLKHSQLRWTRALSHDFALLRDPRLPRDETEMAAFQARCFVLGYGQARRLLDDDKARRYAKGAFTALLDGLER